MMRVEKDKLETQVEGERKGWIMRWKYEMLWKANEV